jgi:hypothetical protein
MEEAGTAVEAEASTAAVAADFMGAAAGSMAEEDSPAGTLGLVAAGALGAVDFVVALMAAGVLMEGAALVAAAGAAEVGAAEAMVGAHEAGAAGVGDLAGAGRIGDMAGAIRMATTVIPGITGPTLICIRLLPRDIRRIT